MATSAAAAHAETARARETLHAEAVEATGELTGLLNMASDLVVNGVGFDAWTKARLPIVTESLITA